MSVNPGALILLVAGVVALIVGMRGTQKGAAQLLTGVGIAATPSTGTGKPSSSPSSGFAPPTGKTAPAAGAGGGGGGGGSW